jgi:hypothetical protein
MQNHQQQESIMDKVKALLQGKKTYIVSIVAIMGIWIDYFFGIGLSSLCDVDSCVLTIQEAGAATWAAITAMTLRAGIAK